MKIDLPDSYVFRFVLVGNRSGLNGETSELQGIEKMKFEHPESPYILCKIPSKNLLVRIQSKLLSYDARWWDDLKCTSFGHNFVYHFM